MEKSTSLADDNDLPAMDPLALDRLRRFGGGKLLGEMVTLFLAAAPERIGAAKTALGASNVAAAEMALHSLKSSSAQLGAMRMQRLSERGELIARGGSLDGVAGVVADLEQEFPRVQTWLQQAANSETA